MNQPKQIVTQLAGLRRPRDSVEIHNSPSIVDWSIMCVVCGAAYWWGRSGRRDAGTA
jgi:hypothetical protein